MTSIVRVAACAVLLPLLLALGACSTSKGTRATPAGAKDTTTGTARGGGYYLDDGPGHLSPADVALIPDAVPRAEPVLARTSRPYTVFGRTYTPMNALVPHRERGMASWYGRRYHGKPTSSGEKYDMYAMTAAHPTLPIPSYVRVTRVDTGRSVVVRVNDRGPFLQNRVIDLSYTAAAKLGFVQMGSAEVEVETITQFGAPDAGTVQQAEAGAGGAAAGAIVPAASTVDAAAAPPQLVAHTSFAHDVASQNGSAPISAEAGASAPVVVPAVDTAATGAAMPAALSSATSAAPSAASGAPSAMPSAAQPATMHASIPAGPTPEAATASRADEASGFWLQFGAFSSADRARAALDRFRRELAWLGARFDVLRDGALYKVQAGPWPQREHALDAASRVRGASAFEPFAVFR